MNSFWLHVGMGVAIGSALDLAIGVALYLKYASLPHEGEIPPPSFREYMGEYLPMCVGKLVLLSWPVFYWVAFLEWRKDKVTALVVAVIASIITLGIIGLSTGHAYFVNLDGLRMRREAKAGRALAARRPRKSSKRG